MNNGPIIAVETVYDENIQISRTFDRKTKEYGWAIVTDDDTEHFDTLADTMAAVTKLIHDQVVAYYERRHKEIPD